MLVGPSGGQEEGVGLKELSLDKMEGRQGVGAVGQGVAEGVRFRDR